MNRSMTIIMISAAMMMTICCESTMVPKTSKIGVGRNIVSACSGLGPRQRYSRYWMEKETPMAVIRKTSRGALRLRKGR